MLAFTMGYPSGGFWPTMLICCIKVYHAWLVKGARPVLEGFVVILHEGTFEQELSITASGLGVLFA